MKIGLRRTLRGCEPVLMRFLLYAAAAAALAPQQHSAALDAVERAIDAAVASTSQPIEALPPAERESVAIARRLRRRLDSFARNGDCRRGTSVSKLRNSVARCGTPILMIHRNCKPVDKNLDSLNSSAAVASPARSAFPPARALRYHYRRRCWLQRAHCVCDSLSLIHI